MMSPWWGSGRKRVRTDVRPTYPAPAVVWRPRRSGSSRGRRWPTSPQAPASSRDCSCRREQPCSRWSRRRDARGARGRGAGRSRGGAIVEAYLPLHAGSLDAITVAQAIHWFDRAPWLAEPHRVLDRAAASACLDHRYPLGAVGRQRLDARRRDRAAGAVARAQGGAGRRCSVTRCVAAPVAATFPNEQRMTPEQVVDRAQHQPRRRRAPDDRRAVLDEIRRVLATDPATRDRGRGHAPLSHRRVLGDPYLIPIHVHTYRAPCTKASCWGPRSSARSSHATRRRWSGASARPGPRLRSARRSARNSRVEGNVAPNRIRSASRRLASVPVCRAHALCRGACLGACRCRRGCTSTTRP